MVAIRDGAAEPGLRERAVFAFAHLSVGLSCDESFRSRYGVPTVPIDMPILQETLITHIRPVSYRTATRSSLKAVLIV